jgi:uncharacterized protein (DUF1697 family)
MKYIAFLRAINVGGHVVKMDHLRRLFTAMGFENVETVIASGNVVFDGPRVSAARIEEALEKALDYRVATFVRTVPELARIAAYKPFAETDRTTLHVGFLARPPSAAAAQKLMALSTKEDELQVNGAEIYWLRHGGFSDSQLSGALLEKTLGGEATFRNVSTVRRIAAKYC